VGVSPKLALLAVVDRWCAGHVKGLELGRVSAEETRTLDRASSNDGADPCELGAFRARPFESSRPIRMAALGRIPASRRAPKEASMTGGRTAIAAALLAGAMALAGAGIAHTGHTKTPRTVVVTDQSLAAEVDVSGDKAVLVAGAIRHGDNEEAGHEMSS
jgi:hypothetical protein